MKTYKVTMECQGERFNVYVDAESKARAKAIAKADGCKVVGVE